MIRVKPDESPEDQSLKTFGDTPADNPAPPPHGAFSSEARALVRTRPRFWALVVLVVSLTATFVLWSGARQESERQLQLDFDLVVANTVSRVKAEFVAHELLLKGFKGLFSTNGYVSRGDFHRYFSALELRARNSGFSALAYHELVPSEELGAHLDSMRREGFSDYRIAPAGDRRVYAPLIYIEPFDGSNRNILGFDPLAVDAEREAIERARDTGAMTISGKLVLAQDHGEMAPGFVMYVPIYRYGFPATDQALRQQNFIGWVDAPYRIADLMSRILPDGLKDTDFEIYDGAKTSANLLYDSDGEPSLAGSPVSERQTDVQFVFGGHTWTLAFRGLPGSGTAEVRQKADFVAATGVLLSIFLSLLAAVTTRWQYQRILAALQRTEDASARLQEAERRRAEITLQESEMRFRSVMENIPSIAVQGYKLDGSVIFWNKASELLYGYSAAEALGANLLNLIVPPEMKNAVSDAMQQMISSGIAAGSGELQLRRKDGSSVSVYSSHALVYPLSGQTELFCLDIDLTERRQAEEQLRKLSLAVDQSPSSIVITNTAGAIEYVNAAFTEKTGYSRDETIGQNPRILKSARTPAETYRTMWSMLTQGLVWKGELHNKRKDGNEYTEFAVIAPLRQSDGRITHYVAIKDDITARKAAEEEINSLAFYDPLTDLPNRRMLVGRLQHALASFARNRQEGALLLIDLDDFKTLNDTHGHDIGDLLLQQVAQRLSACVREGDTIARLGGDEFVVMLENLSGNLQEAASMAKATGEDILASLTQPYQLAGYACLSSPSIGITLFTNHQKTDDLLRQADLAMYQAKAAGRNTLRFFDPEMQKTVMVRAGLEADLREAIKKEQFVLHYQAQVIGNGRQVGAEVLLRWQHPERGMILPGDFIPLAEESKLILPIGLWVLQSACAQLARWASRPETAHLTLAVNVSALQFRQADFVDEVMAALGRHGANPRQLKLELTENVLVESVEDIIDKMAALKAKGVSFSLDDFGTGYSSLSYLKRLPLDQLKIDQGFVRDILTDPNDAAIAKMIVALGESMGLGVIAEGVELEAQWRFLADHGCHAYQGYLFGKPMPISDFEKQIQ